MAESSKRQSLQTEAGKNGPVRSASEHRNKNRFRKFNRSLSSQSHRQEAPSSVPVDNDFYVRVDCPFCLKPLKEKLELVKHLEDGCRIRRRENSISTFQIFPDDRIKCNVCPGDRKPFVFETVEGYLRHLHSLGHVLKHSKAIADGKQLSEFLYCCCCCMTVPNNNTQLEFHLRHRNHQRRTAWSYGRSREKGVRCVYYSLGRRKEFRCLSCQPTDGCFRTPFDMMKHLKKGKHSGESRSSSTESVLCCFCEEVFNAFEIPFHLTTPEHVDNEKKAEASYELCIFCGFSCRTLEELSNHMRVTCGTIAKIRQKETERKGCYVLVKDDIDIVLLLKALKKFGQVKSILKHDNEYYMFEFRDATSMTYLHLAKNLLKVDGKKVCIKFPDEETAREEPETTKPANLKQRK